jgi:DNA-binding NtrC family response regulator
MAPAKHGLDDVESRRSTRSLRLLFVDDDLQVIESARRLLACLRPSWSVERATHTGEAIARLHCDLYDVVIVGLTLPGTDALVTLEWVARRQPAAARVVFSSHLAAASSNPRRRWVQHVLDQPATAGQLLRIMEAALPAELRAQVGNQATG